MSKNRLFNVFVVVVLVVMAALTLRQTVATAKVAAAASNPSLSSSVQQGLSPDTLPCPFTAADRRSMRAVFVKEMGHSLPRDDQGYTGVEGGVLALHEPGCNPR